MLQFLTALALFVLALLPVLAAAPAQAQAALFLTRAQLQAHMEASVFCYYPDGRSACGWAELYTEQNEDHAILLTASAVWDEPMSVERYRIDWRGDALCVPEENQGLEAMLEAEGYRFPFDLDGLTDVDPAGLPARIAELQDGAPREFCFQYTDDPDAPGQLLQHVYRDGVPDEELDPITLIPRFASGAAIRAR